ncbi:protein translocase subunit SecF [Methanocella sp. MCL-LM]|uniref:protein translocase subunit SecF n=1 Tax=Methanocella sp. MCL-LM TaxID=3412035 RepID=UPI003C7827A6
MKADNINKPKAPAQKKEDEEFSPPPTGLLSKLRFPELPLKQAIGLPVAILLVSLLIIGYTFATTGSPLHLGLDFKGGTLITIKTDKSDEQLQTEFAKYPLKLITTGNAGTKSMQFATMDSNQLRELTGYVNANYNNPPIEQVGGVFSEANQSQAVLAVLVAFVGMAITVFVIFRNIVPSVAIIAAAFSDIMFAVAMMNLFHVELTFGTFAALLMLIGYSVDTDILLTTKVLGERKYIDKKISSCRVTGLTMTITAIIAFIILYIFSTFSYLVGFAPIPMLSAIAIVMIFGLLADIINTWLFNAGLLKWYMESPAGRAKYG